MSDDPNRTAVPRVVLEAPADELERALQEGQLVLLKHPVAAQAALRALVAEGRRFATTPAGRRWKEKLAGSELVRRGRVFWESSALGIFEDHPDTLLPSSLLDAIIGATARTDLHALLARLFPNGSDNADAGPS